MVWELLINVSHIPFRSYMHGSMAVGSVFDSTSNHQSTAGLW
jgi:hypothetical protein